MDLSKAFDCVYLDLLEAKLHAYGYSEETLVLFYLFLEGRKQNVKINNPHSEFNILCPVCLKNLLWVKFFLTSFLVINIVDLHNFGW